MSTVRLRLMIRAARIARCLGVPRGTRVSWTLICRRPRTPNWTSASTMTLQVFTTQTNANHCPARGSETDDRPAASAVDESGVEVVARRPVAVGAVLHRHPLVVECRAVHGQQRGTR